MMPETSGSSLASLSQALTLTGASQAVLVVKNPPANAGDVNTQVRSLGR